MQPAMYRHNCREHRKDGLGDANMIGRIANAFVRRPTIHQNLDGSYTVSMEMPKGSRYPKPLTGEIELGESTGARKLGLQRWWWVIVLDWGKVEPDNFTFGARKSALRAARKKAAQLGIKVTRVYNYGQVEDE